MKFKKLGGLEDLKDKNISIHGDMPIAMAAAFDESSKNIDELNKKLEERQKEINKFVKETEEKREYKLVLPEENRKNYKEMHLIENRLSKMSKKQLMEELDKYHTKALKESFPYGINRNVSNELLGMVEEGVLDGYDLALACIKWMGEEDVKEMAKANEFIVDDDIEDESLKEEKECPNYGEKECDGSCDKEDLQEKKTNKPKWQKKGWDLFERVYMNLIATTEPSEKNDEVEEDNRGDRYDYDSVTFSGDGDIQIWRNNLEEFNFAKKIVDYFSQFGVRAEGPSEKNSSRGKYLFKIIIPEEEIRDEMKKEKGEQW